MSCLAYLLLAPDSTPPTKIALGQAWRGLWPDEPALELDDNEAEDGVMVFRFMATMATVSWMPGRYARAELVEPCQAAWHWPQAEQIVHNHATHVIVGLLDPAPASLARTIQLTLLMAAVIEATPGAVGVYWPAGTAVCPPERFIDGARTMQAHDLPLLSWVEFRMFPGADAEHWNLCTTGMRALGKPELEVCNSSRTPEQLIDAAFNVAHELCTTAPESGADPTIVLAGLDQALSLKPVDSAWGASDKVLLLAL